MNDLKGAKSSLSWKNKGTKRERERERERRKTVLLYANRAISCSVRGRSFPLGSEPSARWPMRTRRRRRMVKPPSAHMRLI